MPVLKCQQCEHFFQTKLNEGATYCPKCQTTVYVPDKHDLNRGDTISGFEIVRLVGQGGMGRVYLANQTSMSRMVALKVLPKSFTQDKDAVDQFLNEVRMSGRCQHPNIVSAIDAGEADGEYYFAMAFVDGEDLDNWLEKNGVMPEEEALKYSIKIADALHYAWEKHGLFHRDIKPGNIMLNQQKEVFLLDMGIAQRIGDRAADESKSILGSPFYMSPEQAKADQLNWRTDLYSLGATLYHLIVGVPPYDDADVMKIVEKHVRAPFPEPKQRNKKTKISTHTVELIKKMMAKDADERFDSWPEMQRAVKRVIKQIRADKKASQVSTNTTTITTKFPRDTKTKSIKTTSIKKNVSENLKKDALKKLQQRKKPSVFWGVNMVLLVFTISIIVYILYSYLKNSKAQKAYAKAKNSWEAIENPNLDDYKFAFRLFSEAAKFSKGTKYEKACVAKHRQLRKFILNAARQQKDFDYALGRATELFDLMKHREALRVLEKAPKSINPKKQREADRVKRMLKEAIAKKSGGGKVELNDDEKERKRLLKELGVDK